MESVLPFNINESLPCVCPPIKPLNLQTLILIGDAPIIDNDKINLSQKHF